MKNKQHDTGIADFNLFPQNLRVLICYGLHKNAVDFANAVGIKDSYRLTEVMKGRLKPNKKEIDTITKATGLTLSQLCNVEMKLKLII